MKSLKEMEIYAKNNYVPIIRKDNIEYLENLIKEKKILNILELGSAIGYSAIRMALVDKNIHVTTIERDEKMYLQAKENIKDMDLEEQITLIFDDIFNVDLKGKYDLIFIDAAKAQYVKFFNKFKDNLNDNGYIISDNLELLDLQRLTSSKRSMRLVTKMNEYKDFLNSLDDFYSKYIYIGDGFAITRKSIYKQILNSKYFKETYALIEEMKKDFPVNHGFIHINNVVNNAKNICDFFNYDSYKKELLLIACLLHDIGYLKGRDEHPLNGGKLAKEYLESLNLLTIQEIEIITKAISNHGGKLLSDYENDISLGLILADKMDFSKIRYSNDVNKYPKVEAFLNIEEIKLEKIDETNYLTVRVNEKFKSSESSDNYFEKLNTVLNNLKESRGIEIIIRKVIV